MEWLIQVGLAMALIALMIGFRMFSSQVIFRFRMNNGFRAHECDGSCHRHPSEPSTPTENEHRI
jgi:hypothetical protein